MSIDSKWIITILAALYVLGNLLSKSLMSLGGTVFSLVALVLVVLELGSKNSSALRRFFSVTLLCYVVYSLVTHFFKGWSGVLSKEVLETTPLFLMGALVLSRTRFTESHKKFLLGSAVLGVFLCLIPAIPQFLSRKPVSAFFEIYIFFAHSVLVVLCFLVEAFLSKIFQKKWEIGLLLLAILSAYFLLYASQSRAAFLSFHVYAFLRFSYVALKDRKWRRLAVPALLLFVLGSLAFVFVPGSRGNKLLNLSADRSLQTRFVLWQFNKDLFSENPLFGVGKRRNFAYHKDIKEKYNYDAHVEPGIRHYAHSIYYQELAEGGLFGALLLVLMLGSLYWVAPVTWPMVLILLVAGIPDTLLTKMEYLHPFMFFLGLWPSFFSQREKEFTLS